MKKLLCSTSVLCLLAAGPAAAQSNTAVGIGQSEANSQSGALAVSTNRGNGNSNSSLTVNNPANTTATVNSNVSGTTTSNINSRLTTSGTTTVRTAPSMVAPGLAAAGLETCLGSASGTVSAIGFGIGGGSTYADEGCQARLDSRTLFSYGLKAAAVARLCQRVDIWRSMPDMCVQYWPAGQPYPAGIAVVVPSANITMSTDSARGGIIRVIDGRDGIEKDCLNYSYTKQKCYQWSGESRAPRTRSAALTPTKSVGAKRPPPPPPAVEAIETAAPTPSNQ